MKSVIIIATLDMNFTLDILINGKEISAAVDRKTGRFLDLEWRG